MHTPFARAVGLVGLLCWLGAGCDTGSPAAPAATIDPPAASAPGRSRSYDPDWAGSASTRTVSLDYDSALTSPRNGALLVAAMVALQPGDRLEIGAGTWRMDRYLDVVLQGTASAPIWIVAAEGATPILTRSDATQNVMNVGSSRHTRYLCLRGLEFTGGSALLRLYQCSHVWVDRCHLHHGGEVSLTANTADTDHLHITRNEIHDSGGTAEGMYLGANHGKVVMRDSVIALNHVHDCAGTQGDGIEVKQGSHSNWIVENHVHDTQYPAITVYGTGGNPPNLIERNVCYRSGDNVMQVQGEAIVRNNLLISGRGAGFASHDHQGQTRDLVVVHNTIVNSGRGMNLSSWDGRAGMVLANNAVYSESAESIRFAGGSTGVELTGNVVFGKVVGVSRGTTAGKGLADFEGMGFDAATRDARPGTGSALLGAGDAAFAVSEDLTGSPRQSGLESGCHDVP